MNKICLSLAFLTSLLLGSCHITTTKRKAHNIYDTTYQMMVTCPDGQMKAGTISAIGRNLLVSAGHTIQACEGGVAPTEIIIGHTTPIMAIEIISVGNDELDIATFKSSKPLPDFNQYTYDLPLKGDSVCVLTRHEVVKCGYVTYIKNGLMIAGIRGVKGDSGSPIFNKDWKLIGVLTRASSDPEGEYYILGVGVASWRHLLTK